MNEQKVITIKTRDMPCVLRQSIPDLHHFCNTDMETARCCPVPRQSWGRTAGTLSGCPTLPSLYRSPQTLQRSLTLWFEFYDAVVITSERSPGAWCKLLVEEFLGDRETIGTDTAYSEADIESVSRSPQYPWHVSHLCPPLHIRSLSLSWAWLWPPAGGPGLRGQYCYC